MVTINTISQKYFSLDGIQYARIYQPLKQGLENIGIYSIYDTRQQVVDSTKYDEYMIDAATYGNQALTIAALLDVIYFQSSSEFPTRQRVSPTISVGILDIDFDSKNDYKTIAEVAASADFAITVSNDTNADIATIDLFITNTIIITLPSGSIMEDSETRWVGTPTFELTIEGGTGESFELSLNKVGSKYKWVMSQKFI